MINGFRLSGISSAISLAAWAHREQSDLNGDAYILHPLRVMQNVEQLGGSEIAMEVAVLHDVVEDTDFTLQGLIDLGLSLQVAASLEAITHLPNEPYMEYVKRANRDPIARLVKVADIMDNSDPERLSRLPESKQKRLRAKYGEAMDYLGIVHDDGAWAVA